MIATIYILPKTKIAVVFSQRSSLMTKLHEAKTIKFVHRSESKLLCEKKKKRKDKKGKLDKAVRCSEAYTPQRLGFLFLL